MNELRRFNLKRLISTKYVDDRKAFCRDAKMSESRLAQLLSASYRDGSGFGEKAARAIEARLQLPELWLDDRNAPGIVTIDWLMETSGGAKAIKLKDRPTAPEERVVRLESSTYSSSTIKAFEAVEMAETTAISWFGSVEASAYIQLGYAYDDTMEPTFRSGDMLFVDLRLKARRYPEEDGIYVFTHHKKHHVKRLQRVGDKVAIKSDNPLYETWYLTSEEMESGKFVIWGKVIKSLPMNLRTHS